MDYFAVYRRTGVPWRDRVHDFREDLCASLTNWDHWWRFVEGEPGNEETGGVNTWYRFGKCWICGQHMGRKVDNLPSVGTDEVVEWKTSWEWTSRCTGTNWFTSGHVKREGTLLDWARQDS